MHAAPAPTNLLSSLPVVVVAASESADRLVALRMNGTQVVEIVDSAERQDGVREGLRGRWASLAVVTAAPDVVRGALGAHGAPSSAPVWDALELAGLLAPDCAADSIDAAARAFGLEREERDLVGDARLVAGLFARLVERLESLDATTLLQVNRLAAPLDWPLRHLFVEVERVRARARLAEQAVPGGLGFMPSLPAKKRTPLAPTSRPRPLDVGEAVARLQPGGRVASVLPHYEPRPEQQAMVEAVGHALNDSARLLVEAGTGTGKSVAYLLPAAMLAVQNDWRVVVSTATTNLQDQLFQKDLPVVRASLDEPERLRATVLKGRSNYLCLRRWQTLLHATDLQRHERSLLIKTLFWLPRTETGDRAELRLSQREEEAWQRVCAISEACTPARCAYHKLGVCYLARARRTAEESHIVVANHALLLSDLANGSRVLPDYQVLIVDEAHHLEDEATAQLGWRLGERDLTSRLDILWSPSSGARGAVGAIPEALAELRRAGNGGQVRAAELGSQAAQCEPAIVEVGRIIRAFFGRLAALFDDGEVATDDGTLTLRVTGAIRSGSLWEEAEGLWAEAMHRMPAVLQVAVELGLRLEELPGATDEARGLATELANQVEFWRTLRTRVDAAVHAPDSASVYWLSGGRGGPTWLNAAPLEVATILREGLFTIPEAVVLVSATLSVDDSFAYVQSRLGLEDAETIAVGSPFDYPRAALMYVPHDVPDPTQDGYQHLLQEVLFDTVSRLGGRTLVLFTSRAQLRATYAALAPRLASARVTLLAQGVNEGSRTRLLEAFRRGQRVALLGTNSFWEGIDVVGEALSCVVVARLPFAVPTDPIYAARSEQFDEPFAQYAVPQAVLRLKQGFGRLIRSRTDRGAVVVLDRRLLTRNYGSVFVRSLPPCTVEQGPATRTGRVVADWLAQPVVT